MDVLNYMNETGTSSYDAAAIFNISSPANDSKMENKV